MVSMTKSERLQAASRVLAALAAAVLLVAAWRAFPGFLPAPGRPPGARPGLSADLVFAWTRGLVPLTAALLMVWYALAGHRDVERRRIKLAMLASAATLGVVAIPAFVIFTALAFAGGSNLGPIVGMIAAVYAAPSALFVGAVVGFVASRFTSGRILEE
jgi:hypothetical protein